MCGLEIEMDRKLTDVIDEILEIIPEQETDFINQLKDIHASVSCAPPELFGTWWSETYETLWSNIPPKPTEYWQYKVLSIFSTKSVDEIKDAIRLSEE